MDGNGVHCSLEAPERELTPLADPDEPFAGIDSPDRRRCESLFGANGA
jgi:hypothetical protein